MSTESIKGVLVQTPYSVFAYGVQSHLPSESIFHDIRFDQMATLPEGQRERPLVGDNNQYGSGRTRSSYGISVNLTHK
jgi:hypothetical protein